MKLWRAFLLSLISWNTFGILILLLKYDVGDKGNVPVPSEVSFDSQHGLGSIPTKSDQDLRGAMVTTEVLLKSNFNVHNFKTRKFREEHLNVPLAYFNRTRVNAPRHRIRNVLQFPDIQDIKFNNIYWQTVTLQGVTFYLYSAYYDDRREKTGKGPALVRILGMVDNVALPAVRCVLWQDGGRRRVFSSWVSYEHLWRKYWGNVKNGTLQPYLISCAVPPMTNGTQSPKFPEMVSLVALDQKRPCTNLRVMNEKPYQGKKDDFVVCVKGLDFPTQDLSLRLLEWIHLLHIIGASKIYFYELDVHPNVATLFDYLESKQMIEVIPLTLPGYQPNLHLLRTLYLQRMMGVKRLNEIIPYNDCLYRNLYRYNFVVLLDIDEVIMPTSSNTWTGLMQQIQSIAELSKPKNYRAASYNVRNVYFFDDLEHEGEEMQEIPPYLFMSRHVIRSAIFTKPGRYVKCFHDVSRVQALHNHYPFSCLQGYPCVSFDVSPYMAQLQHYRHDCHDIKMASCLNTFKNHTVLDTNIWRYKDQLNELITKDLDNLRLLLELDT